MQHLGLTSSADLAASRPRLTSVAALGRRLWRLARAPALAACLLAVLAPACASPGPAGLSRTSAPGWVDDAYWSCDAARQLAGVGHARGIGREAEDGARRSAMRRINEDILSSVRSELTTASSESASSSGETGWQQSLVENIQVDSQGELPAASVADRWVDTAGNVTWVRVTADRELLVDSLLGPVEESLRAAEGLLDGLQANGADKAQELTSLLRAYNLLARSFPEALRAAAAAHTGTRGAPLLGAASRAARSRDRSQQLQAHLSQQIARIGPQLRIEKLAGDAQQGAPRGRLQELLVGRIAFQGEDGSVQDLALVPVRFAADVGGARRAPTLVPSGATTGEDGRVTCEVRDLVAGAQGQGAIVLGIDVESLGSSRLAGALPTARFVYSVLTAGQTAVAVGIETVYDGVPLPGVNVTAAVADHLTQAGFKAAARHDISGLAGPALRARLGSEFQYAIRGKVTASYSSQQAGSFFFVASAQIEIVDLTTGDVVQTLAGQAKSVAGERSAAGARRAVDQLLPRELLPALDAGFVGDFGA